MGSIIYKKGERRMKKVINWIYHGQCDEANKGLKEYIPKEVLEKSLEQYKKLCELFTEEQKALFLEYQETEGEVYGLQLDNAFERGFKMGVLLGLEIADFEG